jgi:hypothetical protein
VFKVSVYDWVRDSPANGLTEDSGRLEWIYDTNKCLILAQDDGWYVRPLVQSDIINLLSGEGDLVGDTLYGGSTWEENHILKVPSSVHKFTPSWVYTMRLISKTDVTWRQIVELGQKGWIPRYGVELWFRSLFLWNEIPSCVIDLYGSRNTKPLEKEVCVGCKIMEHVRLWCGRAMPCYGHRIHETVDKECSLQKLNELDSLMVSQVFDILCGTTKGVWPMDQYIKSLNSYFPYNEAVGQANANLDLGTVVRSLVEKAGVCQQVLLAIKFILRWYVGSRNQLVATLLLIVFGVEPNELDWEYIVDEGMIFVCENTWIDYQKYHHNRIRKARGDTTETWKSEVVSNMLYWHVMLGRSSGTISWADEARERIADVPTKYGFRDGVWSEEEGDNLIRESLEQVFTNLIPKRSQLESMEDHFKRRFEWFASGSAVGYSSTLKTEDIRTLFGDEVESGDRARGNKRSVGEQLKWEDIWKIVLEKEPFLLAKGQVKLNELGGKVRSIFNVILNHFILDEMIAYDIEDGLNIEGIDLKEDPVEALKQIEVRRKWCLDGDCVDSYDYPNFNNMHQSKHYALIYELAALWYKKHYSQDPNCDDKIRLCIWLSKAVKNQWFYSPDGEEYYKVMGTLFSGSRDTTLVNTLLNRAYGHLIEMTNRRVTGLRSIKKSYFHGDDLVSKSTDIPNSLVWNNTASRCGLGANSIKLITDIGYCEYLRFLYFPDGKVLGSICRAVATFINGNWESEANRDPIGRARSLWDQVAVIYRRGLRADISNVIFEKSVNYWSPTMNRGSIGPSLSIKFLRLSTKDGGLGLNEFGNIKPSLSLVKRSIGQEIRKLLSNDLEESKLLGVRLDALDIPKNMTVDYISYFNEKLKGLFYFKKDDIPKLRGDLLLSTVGLELPKKFNEVSYSNENLVELNRIISNSETVEPNILLLNNMPLSGSLESVKSTNKIRLSLNRYNRLKPILPYLRPVGKSKRKALSEWLNVELADLDRMRILDDHKIDRVDGGLLNNLAFSYLISNLSGSITMGENVDGIILSTIFERYWWISDLRV